MCAAPLKEEEVKVIKDPKALLKGKSEEGDEEQTETSKKDGGEEGQGVLPAVKSSRRKEDIGGIGGMVA
ncbi:hypothetical protein HK097_011206 [Rhizophlyctis rosea]|uniref:Uncharacterized protein n=1 Tax=Rhizophlyctis rosea TaxID=64517 RepID=A0AAD5SIB2_9FUNG|nr:hypothetical protein HK097_011206 [Rhizophlyctis rosea]